MSWSFTEKSFLKEVGFERKLDHVRGNEDK